MTKQPVAGTRLEPWRAAALQLRLPHLRLALASTTALAERIASIESPTAGDTPTPPTWGPATSPLNPIDMCTLDNSGSIAAPQLSGYDDGTPVTLAVAGGGAVAARALQQVDAGLAMLAALPPGAEAAGLQALDSALRADSVEVLLTGGWKALERFQVRVWLTISPWCSSSLIWCYNLTILPLKRLRIPQAQCMPKI